MGSTASNHTSPPQQMRVIAQFGDDSAELSAHLAASKLEAEGLSCLSSSTIILPRQLLVRLAVPLAQVDQAIEVLSQTPARDHLLPPGSNAPPSAQRRTTCPRCGETDLRRASRFRIILAGWLALTPLLLIDVLGPPLFACLSIAWAMWWLMDKTYLCCKCGHRWHSESHCRI